MFRAAQFMCNAPVHVLQVNIVLQCKTSGVGGDSLDVTLEGRKSHLIIDLRLLYSPCGAAFVESSGASACSGKVAAHL